MNSVTLTFPWPPTAGLSTHQVDITEVVEPEVVAGGGGCGELVPLKRSVAHVHGRGETTQHPHVSAALCAHQLQQHSTDYTCLSTLTRFPQGNKSRIPLPFYLYDTLDTRSTILHYLSFIFKFKYPEILSPCHN
jgi:hypothetical protein